MNSQSPLSNNNPVQSYEHDLVPALFLPAAQLLLQYAQPLPGERVLDVACGTGIVTRQIAPHLGAKGKVTGLDINPAMLAMARSLPKPAGAPVEWKEGSVLALPFPDLAFDLVLCQQGLQFFPDRGAALREMRRVLVVDGRIVVSVQQSLDQNPVYQEFNAALVRHLGIPALAMPFVIGDAAQLETLLTQAGFRQIEIIPMTHPVRFPDANVFIQATILGSAAAVTALAGLDGSARTELAGKISQDMDKTLAHYTGDNGLEFTMAAHMGRARA